MEKTMTFMNDPRVANAGTSSIRAMLIGAPARTYEFFSGLADSWRRYRTFVETQEALSQLSKRELDDLGIDRSMITRVAMDAAYEK
jgi:uncharacterized protein YjiS (DUF1127 family)